MNEQDDPVNDDERLPASTPRRAPRPLRLIGALRSAVLWAGAAIGVLCLALFLLSALLGVRPQVVVSGSMEPTLPVGSLALAQSVPARDVAPGDIVTVDRPDGRGLLTHRVVATTTDRDGVVRLTLKGDANLADDPAPYPVATVGRHVATLPGLGALALFFRTPLGAASIGLVAVVLFAAFAVRPPREAEPAGREEPARAERPTAPEPPAASAPASADPAR